MTLDQACPDMAHHGPQTNFRWPACLSNCKQMYDEFIEDLCKVWASYSYTMLLIIGSLFEC